MRGYHPRKRLSATPLLTWLLFLPSLSSVHSCQDEDEYQEGSCEFSTLLLVLLGRHFWEGGEKRKKVISTQVRMKIQLCDEASTFPEASGALEFRKIVLIIASGIVSFPPTATESNKSHGH